MKRLSIILLLFLNIYILKAQKIDLSFEKAVEIALEKNVELIQQKNQLEVYQADKRASIFQYTPYVNASLSGNQRDGRSFDQNIGQIVDRRFNNISGDLTASIDVFDGFERINSIKASNYLLNAWQNNLKRSEQDVILGVAEQYLQTLHDREILRIARQNLENQKSLLQQIEEFYEAGTRNATTGGTSYPC